MIRIVAAAAILLFLTSTASSARLNLSCTDNPDLAYDPATGYVELIPGTGEKNKIIGFVLANTSGAFKPESDGSFTGRTPWADAVYDNLPKQIGSSDIGGVGAAPGQSIGLGYIFPTGLDVQGLFNLLSQADVLWKRGAGGKGTLDFRGGQCIPEPSTSLLGFIGAATILAHKRSRRCSS